MKIFYYTLCLILSINILFQLEMDKIVDRQQNIDPDIWILEVEEPEGTHLLNDIN